MNDSEVKKCPKCGSEMKRGKYVFGYMRQPSRLAKASDFWGNTIIPFYCEKCGYIELYDEKNLNKE
jgi:predicted nucleic-acid-binding Zn-ribbon protein